MIEEWTGKQTSLSWKSTVYIMRCRANNLPELETISVENLWTDKSTFPRALCLWLRWVGAPCFCCRFVVRWVIRLEIRLENTCEGFILGLILMKAFKSIDVCQSELRYAQQWNVWCYFGIQLSLDHCVHNESIACMAWVDYDFSGIAGRNPASETWSLYRTLFIYCLLNKPLVYCWNGAHSPLHAVLRKLMPVRPHSQFRKICHKHFSYGQRYRVHLEFCQFPDTFLFTDSLKGV